MLLIRTFFGTPIIFSKYLKRESRFMEKILSRNKPIKPTKILNAVSPTLFPDNSVQVINKKRIAVLNKLFMKYITDIMSTGNVDKSMIDKGVEVSKVAVTPNFQSINVFWYSSNMNNDENIDQQFNIMAGKIHHELSQLRLMGFVPTITFIRDKKKSKIEEVENLLVTVCNIVHNETEKDDIKLSYEPPNIPEMTSNVYGLEHDKIMKRIIIAKGRRVNHIKPNDEKFSASYSDPVKNKI